jgi:hypothetical protein
MPLEASTAVRQTENIRLKFDLEEPSLAGSLRSSVLGFRHCLQRTGALGSALTYPAQRPLHRSS